MATQREIKQRIKSVKNIVKVTGALEAVSASKVRRAQAQVTATRAYAAAAMEILRDVATNANDAAHPLLTARDTVKAASMILITSDRGLAGPYNTNVIRAATDFEDELSVPLQYISVGRKGRDILLRRGATIIADFENLPDEPTILDITAITRGAVDDFLNDVVDEVYIAYTDFVNTLRLEPRVIRLLPLQSAQVGMQDDPEESGSSGPKAVYSYEPDATAILEEILPRFTELQLYQAVLESLASEHSARMVAMRNATENGNALADELTLHYNKARQLSITSEMLDIVGGAEALSQSE